jgi:hypothetical protein
MENLKRPAMYVAIILILFALVVGFYNIIIKNSDTSKNTQDTSEETTISNTYSSNTNNDSTSNNSNSSSNNNTHISVTTSDDNSNIISEDNYTDDEDIITDEDADEIAAEEQEALQNSFYTNSDDIGESEIQTYIDASTGVEFSIGTDKDTSSLKGIVLNPVYNGTASHYIYNISATSGYISGYDSENTLKPFEDAFRSAKNLYMVDKSLNFINTAYIDNDQYGIMWIGDVGDTSSTITIRVVNYDTFAIEQVYDVVIATNSEGKLIISGISTRYISSKLVSDVCENMFNQINELAETKYLFDFFKEENISNIYVEKVNDLYFNSMTLTDMSTVKYKGRILASAYPMYAVTLNDIKRDSVTLYLSASTYEIQGYDEVFYGSLLRLLKEKYPDYSYEGLEDSYDDYEESVESSDSGYIEKEGYYNTDN